MPDPSVLGQQDTSLPAPAPASSRGVLGLDVNFDLNFLTGGWQEFNDDKDNMGDAYEAGVLGGVLGAEDSAQAIELAGDQAASGAGGESAANCQQDRAKEPRKISAKGLISTFVLSIIGSTTLGLAAQMRRGGWILPPLTLVVGCMIVSENTYLVTKTIDHLQAQSGITVIAYPDFAKGAFGLWGKRLASVSSMCALIGMTLTSLVLESENFNYTLPINWPWPGCHNSECGKKWWAVLLTPASMLCVFGNPTALLKRVAAIGVVVCALTVMLAWYGGARAVADQDDIPVSCRRRHYALPSSDFGLMAFAEVGAYSFYSFAVIVTVPSLRYQMKNTAHTAPAACFSYFLTLLMFLPIMFLGYWGFSSQVPMNLIDGMRENRPNGWWALNRPWDTGDLSGAGVALDLVVTLNLLLTDAVYVPCTIMAIEASFPNTFRKGPRSASIAMRWGYVIFRVVVATGVELFVAMTSLVSSLFCVCNNIILPILGFHVCRVEEVSMLRKFLHCLVLLYSLLLLLFGTYASFVALFGGSEETLALAGTSIAHDTSSACLAAYRAVTNSSL